MGCVHVDAETSVALASNVQSYVQQGELALAMVLLLHKSVLRVWLEIDCLTNKGSKCDCFSCHEGNIYGMSYFQNMLQQTV